MPDRWINGPVMPNLLEIGLDSHRVLVATGFYSGERLDWLAGHLQCDELVLLTRVTVEAWAGRSIDPPGLLRFAERVEASGVALELRTHRNAHAKFYAAERGVLVGSANLTMPGFGGDAKEVMLLTSPGRNASRIFERYRKDLSFMSSDELGDFVRGNKVKVAELRKRLRATRPPRLSQDRISAATSPAGEYSDFLRWCSRLKSAGAVEIAARGRGKGNLQGHIDRNFHGIRQFFLARPDEMERLRGVRPETYRLFADDGMDRRLAEFVRKHAVNEPGFVLEIWRTYLPKECGGRAGKRGGTIGNLNRMLPLIARYLWRQAQR